MMHYNELLESFGTFLAAVARAEHGDRSAQLQACQLSDQLRRDLKAYRRQCRQAARHRL